MTDTERGLLRAIVENPREDTPRLMYADFLEDDGRRDHAHMIRRALAKPKRFIHPLGREAVVSFYSDEMRKTVSITVAGGIPAIQLVTCRGFVEGLRLSWSEWAGLRVNLYSSAEAFRREFPLREVEFTTPPVFDEIVPLDMEYAPPREWRWRVCGVDVFLDDKVSRGKDFLLVALGKRWPGIDFTAPRPPVEPHD